MAYKRFFCSLSGEDYSIIRKSPESLIKLFVAIGAFVFFIFVLCFVSLSLLFLNLFEIGPISLIMGIFFAWMITNIYLLVLYTLTKNAFSKSPGLGSTILPYIIKYGFIIFISLLVTKPLEVFIFSKHLDNEIVLYKKEQLDKYNTLTQDYFDKASAQTIILLQEEIKKAKDEASRLTNTTQYKEMLVQNENQKKNLIEKMGVLISKSNFYTQRVILLATKHPISWMVSLLIVIIFLIPAVLKNLISTQNKFYQLKKEIETRIVSEEYAIFVEKYNQIIQSAFGTNYSWIEQYDDPPFNYSRKVESKTIFSEMDFIKSLYHD